MAKEEVFADNLIIFNKLRVSPAGVALESDPKSGAGYDVRRGAGYSRVRPDSPTMGSAWPGMRDITAINLAAVWCGVVWYGMRCCVVWCGVVRCRWCIG